MQATRLTRLSLPPQAQRRYPSQKATGRKCDVVRVMPDLGNPGGFAWGFNYVPGCGVDYVPDIKRAPGVIVTTDYKTVTWGRIRSKWDISGV